MSGYRELSEPTRLGGPEGDWVDFPASPDPDPWGTLLRKANRIPPDVSGTRQWVLTSLAMALRGLLVTTTAVAIVAFLLLTNSHV